MKVKLVKELMIPLSEYATVHEDDTLKIAIKTLQDSQKLNISTHYMHRAVLVYDKDKNIVGKMSPLDILKSLEPKYHQVGHPDQMRKMRLSRFGLSNEFMSSIFEQYCLWDESCEELIKTASKLKVKEVMYSLDEGEYVNETASIAEAIHQLIVGHHQSLLVSRNDKVIGILRLSDLFKLVCDIMTDQ
ncbi:MAG: CBS domain-containing protein [Desulfobacteraceae bacterium]|nr:CBS domain-containing protein [Desulfobacteraceae bacterium]